MSALANFGVTETGSTRSGMMVIAAEKQPSVMSPTKGELKRRFKDLHVEKYVTGIEQELTQLKESLKKATEETKKMKRMNKELLE